MDEKEKKIQKLKDYFGKRKDVVMAFLFGSQAKGTARAVSDWDVGVYLQPNSRQLELEADIEYAQRSKIWGDVEGIVGKEVDLVLLNNAASPMVYLALNNGVELANKNRSLYLRLLLKTYYEAIDFWQFTEDYFRIRERSASLSPQDRDNLSRHIIFLENELKDLPRFVAVTQMQYMQDKDTKRIIERFVENLVMASLDIVKIILSSEKKNVPNSYKETLKSFGLYYLDEQFADQFAQFADLRNIVAHEYLDLRWKSISSFLEQSVLLYPRFVEEAKKFLNPA